MVRHSMIFEHGGNVQISGSFFRSTITRADVRHILRTNNEIVAVQMNFLERFLDYFNGGVRERALKNLFALSAACRTYQQSANQYTKTAALHIAERSYTQLRSLATDEFRNENLEAFDGQRIFVLGFPGQKLRATFDFSMDESLAKFPRVPVPIPIRYEPPDPVRLGLHRPADQGNYWPCMEGFFDEGSKYNANQLFCDFQRHCRACENSTVPSSDGLQGTAIEKFKKLILLAKPDCRSSFSRSGFNHATRLTFRIDMPIKPGSAVIRGRLFSCFNKDLARLTADRYNSSRVAQKLRHPTRAPAALGSIKEGYEGEDDSE